MPSTKRLCERAGLSTCIVVLLMIIPGAPAAAAEGDVPGCKPVIGRVVSRQGTVEIRRTGDSVWHRVERLDTQVCDGDAVRTGPRSRAALWLQPENLIRLDQRTAVTIAANQAETKVEFFTSGQVSADPDCGAAYFISRFPRNFGVKTPFLSAAIKGTEFLVGAQCSATTLAVFEGIVEAQELLTGRTFLVESLQQIRVGPGLPSTIPIPIKPRDGVQWTIHYPRLVARGSTALEPRPDQCAIAPDEPECGVAHIEELLSLGAIAEAKSAIDGLRAKGLGGADLPAIDSVVHLVLNERRNALALAEGAVASDPSSERAWTALSFSKQAKSDHEGALEAARSAVRVSSQSALAKTREAEVLLTLGRFADADVAARAALSLDSEEPRALQVLGFVQLARSESASAQRTLQKSLEIDPSDPQTRLGLGLAKIRQRNLEGGREDIEIATALDPTNAVIRTYLGRAYFEENKSDRDKLAGEQFKLAKQLDPFDPTPWFYEAARKQQSNRLGEAVVEMRRSNELNDRRSVYRPAAALDQDAAARAAGLARVLSELRFDKPAFQTTADALTEDPSSFAAQQHLSDLTRYEDRQQVAHTSSGLQAQLRAPLGADTRLVGLTSTNSLDPGRPFLSTDSIGPPRPGLYDFDPLFSGPGFRLRARGLTGSFGTGAYELAASSASDRSSVAFGLAHVESDGQRENNDQARDAYAALISIKPTSAITLQVDAQLSEAKFGDLPIRWDETAILASNRNTERFGTGRLGMRAQLSADSELLFTVTQAESMGQLDISGLFPIWIGINGSVTGAEAQYTHNLGVVRMLAGLSFIEGTRRVLLDFPGFGTFPSKAGNREQTAYIYATVMPFGPRFRLIAGAAWDDSKLHSILVNEERVQPKWGVLWQLTQSTTLRWTSLGGTRRLLPGNQTLEPVQVAGFTQLYDDPFGTVARQMTAQLDQRVGDRLFLGGGAGIRRLSVPFTAFDAFGQPIGARTPWTERQGFGYANWLMSDSVALSLQSTREAFERSVDNQGIGSFLKLTQWVTPLTLQWLSPSGIGASARATYLSQNGIFCAANAFVCDLEGTESTVFVDLGVSYRLPRRFGSIGIDLLNVFDEKFKYQSVDTSQFVPFSGRALFARVAINF